MLVKHTAQSEWLHPLLHVKKRTYMHREFCSMQSYFLKIMTFCLYWSFSHLKCAPEVICAWFHSPKEKTTGKFPKFSRQFIIKQCFLSTEFNHKIFLSHSSDWCSNAADCRTTRCEWKVYFSELLLCVVSWCHMILHTETPVGRFIVSVPQVYFGFVVIVIVYTKF